MEESLANIVKEIDSLVSIKDEVRKKLFETFNYCRFSKKLEMEEIIFFKRVSELIYDEEFDKLLKKYEDLNYLISSIINFRKINEEY